MAEPMEEYMCKTRGDHGSGVTRPKIDAKYHFELKGQFLKELRDNTFSGSDHENEHIEKVGDEKNIFKSVKPASSLIKRVYILSLRERMDLDLEARMMGETLILNKSFDPLYGDYIELNNLNEILELRRNRVDDLEPTVEEGEVVNEPVMDIVKTRCDFISGLDYYPSNCDFDRRIHIDYAYNLKFSCMMGFEYVHANFLPILPINVMSKKFYNTIMKDKIEFNGRNELGNFINAPVFIGNFYVITNFTVVKDMDPYLDE
ncbi:hypothetical protein Tco_0086785 [Tanacetum coccineum]